MNDAAPDLASYDLIIVAFSGGKDSLACLIHLIEQGVPRERIELWHHEVDGREGSRLMDWPCTPAYCRAVAKAFGVQLYFSWREGGFRARDAPEGGAHRPRPLRDTRGPGHHGWEREAQHARALPPGVS